MLKMVHFPYNMENQPLHTTKIATCLHFAGSASDMVCGEPLLRG